MYLISDRLHPPVMTLDLNEVNPSLKGMYELLALPDGGSLVRTHYKGKECVTRLDDMGNVVTNLYKTDTPITAFILSPPDDVLVLLKYGTIVRIKLKDGTSVDRYSVKVASLWDGILDDDELVLVDRDGNQMVTYSMSSGYQESKVQGLNRPTSVVKTANNGKGSYIVCNSMEHKINIYDLNWKLRGTIGAKGSGKDQFLFPWSAAVTPKNTILVADYRNHRVLEFSTDGKFLKNILNEKNGIFYPIRTSLSGNYLWISYRAENDMFSECKIRRYQIYSYI